MRFEKSAYVPPLLLLAYFMPVWAWGEPQDYNRDIRPILSENCFSCHGPDEKSRKAKLRLDVAADAYADRKGSVAIKPKDLATSEAWQRILSTDPENVMPPPEAHLELNDVEKAKLKAWIEEGAPYADHWAFTAPTKPAVPGNSANPIDAFINQRLAEKALTPNTRADATMLARRLSFDLTGLPPAWDFVEKLAKDPSPKAYETLVDELLANPHFGERMAMDWLDSSRYADTNGFSIDGGRHMWLWRDWVIQAFNDNKPYDRFIVEQLAGDLLPGATDAERVASGFQRNNMVTHEGGTIPAENLVNYNADRIKTLGEAMLGLTLACAQCHDHKYDPISQRDYFQLFAYFNTLDDKGLDGDGGNNPGPSIKTKTVLKTAELPALEKRIAELENTLKTPDKTILQAWEAREQASLAKRGQGLKLHPLKVTKTSTPNRGGGFGPEGENGVRLKPPGGLGAYDVSAQLPADLTEPVTGIRVVMNPVDGDVSKGWGAGAAGKKGSFRLTSLSITADTQSNDMVNLHKLEPITRATANSWDKAGHPEGVLTTRTSKAWVPDEATNGPVHLTATLATPLNPQKTPFITVQLVFAAGAEHMTFYAMTGEDDGSVLPAEIIAVLAKPVETRSDIEKAQLWEYAAANASELKTARVSLENHKERLAAITQRFTSMVMNVAEKPRETFILNRGDYSQPTEKVAPGTPKVLPPLPQGAPENRLGLAQWMVAPNHPLTSRVAVNRLWRLFFGTGLVATTADFGFQGEWPSHPALLDWLAADFQEHQWDVKRLIKLIVTSDAYCRNSAATNALLEADPQNRLLARGPRFRLAAEMVRDSALASSGLLVPWVGGPSVNPYSPGDLWREVSHYGSTPATAQSFVQDHGEKLYRRSLYTYWKRTAPPPNMVSFDAPNREVCTIDRGMTNTPLQALVTLNDPQFVEAARMLAQRVLEQPGDDETKIRWLFRWTLTREPQSKELAIFKAAIERERKHFSNAPDVAAKTLNVGESPRNEALPPSEHAAWQQVSSMVLNLSETVTKH